MSSYIELTQGEISLVDNDDYERLSKIKWQYNPKGYAMGGKYEGKIHRVIYMHHLVLNTKELFGEYAKTNF